jgi:hypothetical protein
MREALVLPGLEGRRPWQVRGRSDSAALVLADRHYNRGSKGSPWLGPPGRLLVFVTADERAVWATSYHRADLAKDRLDAWRCTLFRNEGPLLSSDLILEAMALTLELWPAPPADGWLTYVDATKVSSPNPGYCFKRAGWELDRSYIGGYWAPGRIRLTSPAVHPIPELELEALERTLR